MDALTTMGAVAGLVGGAVACTWALRTKLSDIEVAIKGHIEEDKAVQADHGARILKLEGRRRR